MQQSNRSGMPENEYGPFEGSSWCLQWFAPPNDWRLCARMPMNTSHVRTIPKVSAEARTSGAPKAFPSHNQSHGDCPANCTTKESIERRQIVWAKRRLHSVVKLFRQVPCVSADPRRRLLVRNEDGTTTCLASWKGCPNSHDHP